MGFPYPRSIENRRVPIPKYLSPLLWFPELKHHLTAPRETLQHFSQKKQQKAARNDIVGTSGAHCTGVPTPASLFDWHLAAVPAACLLGIGPRLGVSYIFSLISKTGVSTRNLIFSHNWWKFTLVSHMIGSCICEGPCLVGPLHHADNIN